MALTVSNSQTLEDLRVSHNDLVDDVGGIGSLRTSQTNSLVHAVNSIIDEYRVNITSGFYVNSVITAIHEQHMSLSVRLHSEVSVYTIFVKYHTIVYG